MKRILPVIMVLTLCACESSPPQTLDERLEGKTEAQQRKVLFNSCLTEADWLNRHEVPSTASTLQRTLSYNRYNRDVVETKDLCRQMDALADPKAKIKLPPQELASKCTALIQKHLKEDAHSADHAKRLRHICEDMTGQVITYE